MKEADPCRTSTVSDEPRPGSFVPSPRSAGTGSEQLARGQDLALAGIAHDARNLVTTLQLCADLIAEPGVLAPDQSHFAGEIRALADYIFEKMELQA